LAQKFNVCMATRWSGLDFFSIPKNPSGGLCKISQFWRRIKMVPRWVIGGRAHEIQRAVFETLGKGPDEKYLPQVEYAEAGSRFDICIVNNKKARRPMRAAYMRQWQEDGLCFPLRQFTLANGQLGPSRTGSGLP